MTVLFWTDTVSAVMPPKHYARQVETSNIKAVAVVEDVTVLQETKRATRKEVVFRLERSFGKEAPVHFRGTCYSVDQKWQKPGVGGTIYFYPVKNQRVLVTVSSNGGAITSYTSLNDALKAQLNAHGLKNIAFVMGHARVNKRTKEIAKKSLWRKLVYFLSR